MAYEPLHHKYRPQTFGDLVGQETISLTLSNALEQARIAPAYLFTGPRGTGKTSSARILAKSLNCLASDRPTPHPCGKCEVCLAIAKGSALDVMEIDAASNTGVDNIREIIERSRFAPVQCRYKIYAIDECLTGDSLILTNEGLMRIDNPDLKGKKVLSYNERKKVWEYKKVLRWLERGKKKTITIKTGSSQISCTANHLIRTETGWIEAGNVKEGMKILSPASVDVALPSTNTGLMVDEEDSLGDTNLKEISTERSLIVSVQSLSKQRQYSLPVNADVKKNWVFLTFSNKKEKELKVLNPIGVGIPTEKVMDFGINEAKILSIPVSNYKLSNEDLFTELYLGMGASNIPTHTVDYLDYVGLTARSNNNGWNTKQPVYSNCDHKYKMLLIGDTAKNQPFAKQLAIHSYEKFTKLLSRVLGVNQSRENGFNLLLLKDLHGGTWMTVLSSLLPKVVPQFFFIPRDFLKERTKLLLNGLQNWDILPSLNLTSENRRRKNTTASQWAQNLVENGCQTHGNTQSPQWNTSLEKVESVSHAGQEKVYDLEVEDNHNFVANGLLVHNCHMLSTAAFNALLKTLEEPPPQVVFILATTDPQRVLSTIISRCQRFDYRRIPLAEMTSHLRYIADTEKIAIADDALTLVAQISNGGLRDAESLLDQLSLLPETITVEKVWDLVGAVSEQDLLKLLQAINSNDSIAVLQQCRSLLDRGREPLVVLQNLASFYLNLLIAKTAPQHAELTAVTETCWQQLCESGKDWQTASILRGQQHLKEAETQLKRTTQPRLWLEVTLLGLLPEANNLIAANPQTVVPTSPQQIVTPLPTVVIAPPAIPQAATPSSTPPQNTQATSAIPNKTDRLPSANPTQQPPPSEVQSPPQTVQQHSPSQTNAVTTEPVTPAAVTSSTSQDPAANQQIWDKVVSCLQPPTTQALLKQQCHLVSFDGMSAIVGVSSAQLQKMTQQKVPNIEAAFAQVCQRKVRVQLEVASAKKNANNNVNNSLASIPQSLAEAPANTPQQPPPSPPVNTQAQIAQPTAGNVAIQTNGASRQAQSSNLEAKSDARSQSENENASISPLSIPANPSVSDRIAVPDLASNLKSVLDLDYADGELQQAIASLTQSFEGEVVQLDNDLNNSFEEDAEILPELEVTTPSDRADVEDYEWLDDF